MATAPTCPGFFPKRKEGPGANWCSHCDRHRDDHRGKYYPVPPGPQLTPRPPAGIRSSGRKQGRTPGSGCDCGCDPAAPAAVLLPAIQPRVKPEPVTQESPVLPPKQLGFDVPSEAVEALAKWTRSNAPTDAAVPYYPNLSRILVPEMLVTARCKELAREISTYYAGLPPKGGLVVIGVLKGAYTFMAELTKALTVEHTVDFMILSSYGKGTTSGEVRVVLDAREPVSNHHVLLVDDLIDTGKTLQFAKHLVGLRRPASVRVVALCRKVGAGLPDGVVADWLGFDLPNVWLVGCGMDFGDRFRSFPFIAEVVKK